MPPLRERKGDIPELIEFFVDKVNRDLGTSIVGVSDEAAGLLMRHSWPGNVRELENALLRAAVLARGRTLVVDDFALAGQPRQQPASRCRSRRPCASACRSCWHATRARRSATCMGRSSAPSSVPSSSWCSSGPAATR